MAIIGLLPFALSGAPGFRRVGTVAGIPLRSENLKLSLVIPGAMDSDLFLCSHDVTIFLSLLLFLAREAFPFSMTIRATY